MCEPIGQEAVDVVIRAKLSVVEMQSRYRRTSTFGADANALANVPDGLDLYDQLLTFSNPLQLVRAVKDSWKRIENGDVLASVDPRLDRPAWQCLTDDNIYAIGRHLGNSCRLGGNSNIDIDYARAIEAKLKELSHD